MLPLSFMFQTLHSPELGHSEEVVQRLVCHARYPLLASCRQVAPVHRTLNFYCCLSFLSSSFHRDTEDPPTQHASSLQCCLMVVRNSWQVCKDDVVAGFLSCAGLANNVSLSPQKDKERERD